MKKKMVGLIYTGERINQLRDLTRTRAVAAQIDVARAGGFGMA